jgi:hypothetical protein
VCRGTVILSACRVEQHLETFDARIFLAERCRGEPGGEIETHGVLISFGDHGEVRAS